MSYRRKKSVHALAAAGLALLVAHSAQSGVRPVAAAVGPRAELLRPNLVVLKAADMYIQHTSAGRLLRFESALGNIGRGPIEVRPNENRPCPSGQRHATQVVYRDTDGSRRFRRDVDTDLARRSAGCMVFHPAHNHWHFEAASRYSLFQPKIDRPVRVAHRKMSFCLRDSRRVPASYGTFRYVAFYGACSRDSLQGISIGWADVYQSFLPGQAMRLPASARDGLYCLAIRVDPRNQLLESNDDDNTSVRAFTMTGDRIRFERAARCS